MLRKTIRNRILLLTLIPTLLICFLLGVGLTALYLSQLDAIPAQRGAVAGEQLARLVEFTRNSGNTAMLQTLLNTALEEPGVKAVQILSARGSTTARAGSRITPPQNFPDSAIYTEKTVSLKDKNRHYFVTPIHTVHSEKPAGWLMLEINTTSSTLMKYRGVMIALSTMILVLGCTALLTMDLNNAVSVPLVKMKQGIDQLAQGNLNTRIEIDKDNEFNELAESVNTMAALLHKSKQEMQQHIDQSTEDLRETLETVEIQNIELDLARKGALAASRIKSEFLANTSHEIRTPLSGIVGFATLLLKTELNPQQREYLQAIETSSQGLLTIINDILDFSRIEAGRLMLDYIPLHLRQTIEQTLQILAPAANEKQLQLIPIIERDAPLYLMGDPLRLKQILTNLVSNAIKFSSKGNVIVRVICESIDQSQARLKFLVSDAGIGLSDEQQKMLFNAFSQADTSSSRKHGGTGLGLAISKGLVERMGGEIGVESDAGKGATFWFTAILGLDNVKGNIEQRENFNLLRNQHVAVFDSNSMSLVQLGNYLETWQTTVTKLSCFHDILPTIKEARETLAPVNVLILDTLAYDENISSETLRSLINQLEQHFHCKAVLLTSPCTQRQINEEILQTSAVTVNKPVCHDRLYQALCEQLALNTGNDKPVVSVPSIQAVNEGKTPKVLVVDDNASNLNLIGEILAGLKVDATLAASGLEALQCVNQQAFDLIFMDIQMPGMDGLETTQRIRSQERKGQRTPIIALTAHVLSEQRSQLLLAGMDDYQSKPATEAQLSNIINRWIKLSRQVELKANTTTDNEAVLENKHPEDITPENIPAEMPVVDINESLRLTNGKAVLAKDMLNMLVDSLGKQVEAIGQSLASRDYIKLENQIHQLHGGCCYCGVPRLRGMCAELDTRLQKGQKENIDTLVMAVSAEIGRVQEWALAHDIDEAFAQAGCVQI